MLEETLMAQRPPVRLTEGGVLRVSATRVTIDTVVGAYEDGATPDEIAADYDSLEIADVYGAISYYLRHRDEIETYLQHRNREAHRVRSEVQRRAPQSRLRDRLLARRPAGS